MPTPKNLNFRQHYYSIELTQKLIENNTVNVVYLETNVASDCATDVSIERSILIKGFSPPNPNSGYNLAAIAFYK